jgi:hypothetical protein
MMVPHLRRATLWWRVANKCGHCAANPSRQEGGRPELWCVVLHMHVCVVVVAAYDLEGSVV